MIFISLALILVGFVLMEIMSRRITKMELEMRKNMQNQEIEYDENTAKSLVTNTSGVMFFPIFYPTELMI